MIALNNGNNTLLERREILPGKSVPDSQIKIGHNSQRNASVGLVFLHSVIESTQNRHVFSRSSFLSKNSYTYSVEAFHDSVDSFIITSGSLLRAAVFVIGHVVHSPNLTLWQSQYTQIFCCRDFTRINTSMNNFFRFCFNLIFKLFFFKTKTLGTLLFIIFHGN